MKHVSWPRACLVLGGLSLALPATTGCLKDVGLGGDGDPSPHASTGVGFGTGGAPGMTSGVGGAPGMGVSTGSFGSGGAPGMTSGVGGFPGMTSGVGGAPGMTSGVGGFPGMTSGVGGAPGMTGTGGAPGMTSGVGGSASGCTLPPMMACDFAHLNADCAPYGAVCDYIIGQCSCCFIHDTATCTTDADCQSNFGANAFCSAGTCGCH